MNRLIITPDGFSGGTARRLLQGSGQESTALYSCFDDFTYGPLVRTDPPEALLRLRLRHWHRTVPDPKLHGPFEHWHALRTLMAAADEVEVWLGGTGREQLFLLGLASVLAATWSDSRTVSVLQYPGGKAWESLSTLDIDRFAARPDPLALTAARLDRLLAAWAVVTEPTPDRLFALAPEGWRDENFPYLGRVVQELVGRYPDAVTGLGLIEELLLGSLGPEWTRAPRVISDAMVVWGVTIDIAHQVLFARLLQLADLRQPRPAAELRGDLTSMLVCEARVTDFGRDCLAGRANLVSVNGIDVWIGGVHLASPIPLGWFRCREAALNS